MAACIAVATVARAEVPITACGTEVAVDQVGVLQSDLDCSAAPGVCLECGATGLCAR